MQPLLYTLQVALLMENLGMTMLTQPIWMQLLALVAGFHVPSIIYHFTLYPSPVNTLFGDMIFFARDLSSKVEGDEASARASSLPILLCHGKGTFFFN